MQSMSAQDATPLEIERSFLGTLRFEAFAVPYANLAAWPFIRTRIHVGDTEYTYDRSYPILGHSAVMYGAIADLVDEGRQVLVAERGGRYCVYVA